MNTDQSWSEAVRRVRCGSGAYAPLGCRVSRFPEHDRPTGTPPEHWPEHSRLSLTVSFRLRADPPQSPAAAGRARDEVAPGASSGNAVRTGNCRSPTTNPTYRTRLDHTVHPITRNPASANAAVGPEPPRPQRTRGVPQHTGRRGQSDHRRPRGRRCRRPGPTRCADTEAPSCPRGHRAVTYRRSSRTGTTTNAALPPTRVAPRPAPTTRSPSHQPRRAAHAFTYRRRTPGPGRSRRPAPARTGRARPGPDNTATRHTSHPHAHTVTYRRGPPDQDGHERRPAPTRTHRPRTGPDNTGTVAPATPAPTRSRIGEGPPRPGRSRRPAPARTGRARPRQHRHRRTSHARAHTITYRRRTP
ncbi:hypothetical protein SCANM124S_02095 [Streptomyces canus]